jgi:hypothetical protein
MGFEFDEPLSQRAGEAHKIATLFSQGFASR